MRVWVSYLGNQDMHRPLRYHRYRGHTLQRRHTGGNNKSTDESLGHILMTNLFSGFTLGATPPSMDLCTLIDTFFSHWVVRQHGDGFGLPNNYIYTSSGHLLDTREGKTLCKELELTWKYPKQQKVISLAPDLQYILQDLPVLKVISPGVPGDILLAEALFANNSKIRRDMRLTPFQLVTGQQSTLSLIKDTGEHTHHPLNRLKHLGVQVSDNLGGDLQEV